MRKTSRKSAPKVKNGKVQRKNNLELTPNIWNTRQGELQIIVEKPGKGRRHFLKKRDIRDFISILPDWEILSEELDGVVLTDLSGDCDGYYSDGVVVLGSWPREMDVELERWYYNEHKMLLDRLGVRAQVMKNGIVACEFNEGQIKAYQLLHIFLHELGHHLDRIRTKTKAEPARGEDYAERYAFEMEERMWIGYQDKFGVVF